jgi:DNA-binding CsgD family transcriptional regulator
MTTRTISSAATSTPPLFPHFKRNTTTTSLKPEVPGKSNDTASIYSWERLSSGFPLVHLLQPDYYMVFQYSSPGVPVYQQNLHLDLGSLEVRYEVILGHIETDDLEHLRRMDIVKAQFARECRLQPFDYISSIFIRWVCPQGSRRYFIRKMTVLQSDSKGMPSYGIVSIKDVTTMVSAIRPNNVDITFHPDKASLCYELCRRISAVIPKRSNITAREKDIVRCLCKGMSSKEIASALFISKATVDTHRQNLIHKWGVTNTAALLQRAMEEGCV